MFFSFEESVWPFLVQIYYLYLIDKNGVEYNTMPSFIVFNLIIDIGLQTLCILWEFNSADKSVLSLDYWRQPAVLNIWDSGLGSAGIGARKLGVWRRPFLL